MDSRNTGFLLGAGASVDAGLPTSVGLTESVFRQLAGHEKKAMALALGGLGFENAIVHGDPYEPIDIERVFAALQMLDSRESLEVAPFIESWHASIRSLERAAASSGFTGKFWLQQGIKQAISPRPRTHARTDITHSGGDILDASKLADVITNEIASLREDRKAPIFSMAMRSILHSLIRCLWITSPEKTRYLDPLKDLLVPRTPLKVFSLNYDNVMESWAEAHGRHACRGLTAYEAPVVFDPAADIHLVKLHGSIDWMRGLKHFPMMPPGDFNVTVSREQVEAKNPEYEPLLIFGRSNKLTTEGPFLDLFVSFRNQLDTLERLVVVGYSFRDSHVNDSILRWLRVKKAPKLVVINGPDFSFERLFDKRTGDRFRSSDFVKNTLLRAKEGLASLLDQEAA